jgi:hypothetical protein
MLEQFSTTLASADAPPPVPPAADMPKEKQ